MAGLTSTWSDGTEEPERAKTARANGVPGVLRQFIQALGLRLRLSRAGCERACSRRRVKNVAVDTEVLARATEICLALPEASADDRHSPHRGFRRDG
jgi:hypothetical protein